MEARVLLVESERSVIRDLSCSLRLVDIPVQAAGDVDMATDCALKQRPALVITRAAMNDDAQAAVHVASALAAQEQLRDIPVVLLCTASERTAVEPHLQLFDGELALPIEFPSVTYQVQELLRKFSGGCRRGARDSRPGPAPQLSTVAAAALPVGNLVVAYDIQMSVLEELRQSPHFEEIAVEKVPEAVAAVTQTVCRAYQAKKQ